MDSYDVRKAFERIELELIRSMARNVQRHLDEEEKMGFKWEQWQAEQIKALKRYQKSNQKLYGAEFKKINKAIEEMIRSNALNAAQEEHMRFLLNDLESDKLDAEGDFFHVNSPKLDALIKATTDDLEKAEYAMLRKMNDEYRRTIFDAQVYANTGAGILKQAVDMATRDFLQKGINCVEYADGKKVNIASYAEMAVRTASTRAVNISEGEVRKDRKWHLVRISEYGQCSKMCLPWQGRIYVDDIYSGGTVEESKEKGYPLLSEAIEGGLFHPNCKHRSTTYFPELEEDDENEVEEFENHPLQKDFNVNHRDLQKQKRIEAGSLDETNKKKAKAKRVKAEKKEKELKKEMESKQEEPKVKKKVVEETSSKKKKDGTVEFTSHNSDESYQKIIKAMKVNNVEYNDVQKLDETLSVDEIIDKVGGGDKTGGSCASLALTYAGNRNGLDVTDFRGGISTNVFCSRSVMEEVCKLPNVKSYIDTSYNEMKSATKLLKSMEIDKEYILGVGRHAAVVKHTNEGYFYLELQTERDNGFKKLTANELKSRFRATKSIKIGGMKCEVKTYMIDVESLNGEEFRKTLGYLNTKGNKQMKGVGGYGK